jgi:hypothetical protein
MTNRSRTRRSLVAAAAAAAAIALTACSSSTELPQKGEGGEADLKGSPCACMQLEQHWGPEDYARALRFRAAT